MNLISMSSNLNRALNAASHLEKSQMIGDKIVSKPQRHFLIPGRTAFQLSPGRARRVESDASSCGV
jgi:hypothetical protein